MFLRGRLVQASRCKHRDDLCYPEALRPQPLTYHFTFIAMHLAPEIPPTPKTTPRIIRLFWGRVHKVLIKLAFRYADWRGHKIDNQIIHLPFGLLLKWSDGTRIEEVLAMQVARAAGFPVPRVICYGEHADSPHAPISIIMTRMPGSELGQVYKTLKLEEQDTVMSELKLYMDVMRSWPNPWGRTRICSVSGTAIRSLRVWKHTMGPFENEQQLNRYLTDGTFNEGNMSTSKFEESVSTVNEILKIPHRIVFTHGDLMHHNILVHNGHLSAILDWEAAGWLPEYWEFTSAARLMRPGSWWYDCVKDSLELGNYPKEFEGANALISLTSGAYCW